MNVSFDGLRTNATRSMNRLYDAIKDVIDNEDISIDNKIDLIDTFNESAMFVDTFNCLYDDTVEDDMNNMKNLSIDRLEEIEDV